MTKREAAIVSAYTGYLCGSFSEMHKYAEEIMQRLVFTHEFGNDEFCKQLEAKSKQDFYNINIAEEN